MVTAWVSSSGPLCSRHVCPGSLLLGCQRDQARLLDPAAQADPELRAELECRATERIRAAHYRTPTQCSDETPRAALMLATGMMAERAVRTQQLMAAVLKQGVGFR